jgi:hypothetical protein
MFESIVMTGAMMMPAQTKVPDSTYEGKHYSKRWEPFRRCVVHRESRGDYRARNPKSSAAGAYQFLSSQWTQSLVWMLRPEFGQRVERLRKVALHRWPALYQDAAFFTVVSRTDGRGWRHWYHPSSPCNRLAVKK